MSPFAAIAEKFSGQQKQWRTGREEIKKGRLRTEEQFETGMGAYKPYQQFGREGLRGYSELMADPSSITQRPGYQFRLGEGLRGVEQGASARGSLFSGSVMEELMRYGQQFATEEYDRELARYGSMIGTGEKATSGLAALISGQSQAELGFATGLSGMYRAQAEELTEHGGKIATTVTSLMGK